MADPNKDYEDLLKLPPMPIKARKLTESTEQLATASDIKSLKKRIDILEKVVYNLKYVIEKQILKIKRINNDIDRERQEKPNGRNNR